MLKNEILEWVRDSVERIQGGEDLGRELPPILDFFRHQLDQTYAEYEQEAPTGTEEIRDTMLESIDLYCRALECLEKYLEEPNPKLLALAVRSAEEGSDLLGLVRSIVSQSQDWISQYSEV